MKHDITDKMKEISVLTARFIKAKEIEEKWHVMELTYAGGFSSIGKYMLDSIKFQVEHIHPEYIEWYRLKVEEGARSDFSGSTEGDR